jgi:uncharacterized protein
MDMPDEKKTLRKEVKSPCIQICKYDKNGICEGCHRSMEEITGWIFMTDEKKLEILRKVEVRKNMIVTGQNDYEHYV